MKRIPVLSEESPNEVVVTINNGGVSRAFNILRQIEGTSSSKEKEGLLKTGEGIPELKEMLYLCFNPEKLYYMKKVPEPYTEEDEAIPDIPTEEYRYEEFKKILEQLTSRQIVGNEALTRVRLFFCSCTSEEVYWYTKILQKDMKIGATEKTINKVYGKGFIPEYCCMLAYPLKDYKKLPQRFYCEPKFDGIRDNAENSRVHGVTMLTRNGKMILGFDDVESAIYESLPYGFVYDGEIMGNSFSDMQTKAFKKSNNKQGVLNVFDLIPISEFSKQQSKMKQYDRKQLLREFFDNVDTPHLQLVPDSGILLNNEEGIAAMEEYYRVCLENGYEGIIIKDADAFYQYKRTYSLLKIKPTETFDLEAVGLKEGKNDLKGTLGAIVVKFGEYLVNVGSGLSRQQRDYYWKHKNDIIGKTIEVEAQEVTNNKSGTSSLRFPTFKKIREDK